MNGKLMVAGVGNIFMGDDAFGVEVVQQLARMPLPGNVEVRDFGIRAYDLAYALMEDWDLAILVDALPLGDEPGTLYAFEPDLPTNGETGATVDAHSMNPAGVLQLVNALGGKFGRVLVVGCEPEVVQADDEGRIGLSAPVAAAVNGAIEMILELIGKNKAAAA